MSSSRSGLAEPSLQALTARVQNDFLERYRRQPSVIVAAPGRVNLIGEHIDYNDGFVLPLALERYVVIAADRQLRDKQSTKPEIRLYSMEMSESAVIPLNESTEPYHNSWVSYVEGVVAGFAKLGETAAASDAVIGSNVPVGGGLSSSAALEVATATWLEQLTGRQLDPRQKALLCQQAEHDFAGVPCGIMDQFSSVFGQADQLMLIDCRSQQVQAVPFDSSDVSVLITNSNVRHELSGGEYAERRAQCDSALSKLNYTTWRDVSMEDVHAARDELTETEFQRARHVVTEINRTVQAAQGFRESNWETVGRLMYASHESLRDDYEVSCGELDALVEIARSLGEEGGVIGSRMTGGGFGGCTVTLVKNEQLDAVISTLSTQYESATGIKPACFSSRPARGAHVIKV